ncbi:MAG: hypothetical protein ACOYJG_10395 [Prevotella sp.]|jgi:hypothetical protein
MKKLIIIALLFLPIGLSAQQQSEVQFGTAYDEAMIELKAEYGEPTSQDDNQAVFSSKAYQHGGMTFNEVKCKFKNQKLVEKRFYKQARTKAVAVKNMMLLKKALEKEYSMSEDYEDDGTAFFTGGLSPTGIGRLFTICVMPRNGQWVTLLQYGPFRFN